MRVPGVHAMAALAIVTAMVSAPKISVAGAPEVYEQLKSLVGDWSAELPAFGTITAQVRLASNGKAIEEVIGTPKDNELSVYTLDGERILLTHYCAMTPDGHQVRLQTRSLGLAPQYLDFLFLNSTNLHSKTAPHMRRVLMTILDRDHYREKWTKTEDGHDTEFDLNFARR